MPGCPHDAPDPFCRDPHRVDPTVPVIDREAMGFPEFAEFSRAYYRGRDVFRNQVRKIAEDVYLCEAPLDYLRFLQGALNVTWTTDVRLETSDYRHFVTGMLAVMEQIAARFMLHSAHDVVMEERQIRLSWHTLGKAPQRWHYKAAHLPRRLHFEQGGFSGWSELHGAERGIFARLPAGLADEFHARVFAEYRDSGASKYRQNAEEPVAEEDFIFIPLQLPADSVLGLKLYGGDYLTTIRRVVEILEQSGAVVVLKRHPLCKDAAVAEMLGQVASARVKVSGASIHTLLPKSRCVITVNSGVGFEALMYQRPVVVMGKTDYARAAVEVSDPETILAGVEKAVGKHDAGFTRKFLFGALNVHQIDTRDPLSFQRQALRALCRYYLEKALR